IGPSDAVVGQITIRHRSLEQGQYLFWSCIDELIAIGGGLRVKGSCGGSRRRGGSGCGCSCWCGNGWGRDGGWRRGLHGDGRSSGWRGGGWCRDWWRGLNEGSGGRRGGSRG